MYRQNEALISLFEPEVVVLGYELLGIELGQNGSGSVLKIYIDNDEGITIDDCVLVSQQLSGLLDVEAPIKGSYELEVSSPGLDRPLFTTEQFRRFIGETVKLRLCRKYEGRRHYVGLLVSVNDDMLVIDCDDEGIDVPYDLIEKAHLVPQFDLINGE